jgi:hypothetical protein
MEGEDGSEAGTKRRLGHAVTHGPATIMPCGSRVSRHLALRLALRESLVARLAPTPGPFLDAVIPPVGRMATHSH